MNRSAILQMHLAVILYGFTAILGKLISIDAVSIVWWRVLITSAALFAVIRAWRLFRSIPAKHLLAYAGVGCLIALHWITFFLSIHLANASICLMALATQSFFTSLIEPMVFRRQPKPYEIILGLLMIPAMAFVVSEIDLSMRTGLWIGLVSAFLVAAFTAFNKKLINRAAVLEITFLELAAAWAFITILLPILSLADFSLDLSPTGMDWIYLLILALLCTVFAFGLALNALRSLSAFSTNLIANLEPVYGVGLAWVILGEHTELSTGFYVGSVLVLLIVFSNPVIQKIVRKRHG